VPNGIPLVYKFGQDMRPIPQEDAVKPLSGIWLGKKVGTAGIYAACPAHCGRLSSYCVGCVVVLCHECWATNVCLV
jgi:hypothetical protein